MSVDHQDLLPVGYVIPVLAMSSGISAANFWMPVYRLRIRFEPRLAFWMNLTASGSSHACSPSAKRSPVLQSSVQPWC